MTLDKYVNTLESNLNQYYYPGIIIINFSQRHGSVGCEKTCNAQKYDIHTKLPLESYHIQFW